MSGGDGLDVILASGIGDTLTGGAGADTFVMTLGGDGYTITDFQDGIDKLDITAFDPAGNNYDIWVEQVGADIHISLYDVDDLLPPDYLLPPAVMERTMLNMTVAQLWTEDFIF